MTLSRIIAIVLIVVILAYFVALGLLFAGFERAAKAIVVSIVVAGVVFSIYYFYIFIKALWNDEL